MTTISHRTKKNNHVSRIRNLDVIGVHHHHHLFTFIYLLFLTFTNSKKSRYQYFFNLVSLSLALTVGKRPDFLTTTSLES